jgi:hypothetical protein
MILENKIIVKDKCYQFNEHYEKWKNFPKKEVFNKEKLTEKGSITSRISKENLPKKEVLLPEKGSLGMPNNQGDSIKNKDLKGGEHLSKETLKETLKETIKIKGDIFINTWKDFKEMRIKIKKPMTKKAEELLINKLDRLTNDKEEQIAILNQSIMNSWQGVFPLKDKPKMTMEEALKKMEVNENE